MNCIADSCDLCLLHDSPVWRSRIGRRWPLGGVIMTSRRRPNVCVDRGSMDPCGCCVASVCTAAATDAAAVFSSLRYHCVGDPTQASRLRGSVGLRSTDSLSASLEESSGGARHRRRPSIIDKKAKPSEFSFVGSTRRPNAAHMCRWITYAAGVNRPRIGRLLW